MQKLIAVAELRREALRGLAAYDDAATPAAILAAYSGFNLDEKRDALATLASRVAYAKALLEAVAEKKIVATDLSADLVRQLRNHQDETINERIGELWGIARESSGEKAELIAKYTKLAHEKSPPADPALGRAVFAKTCQQCHTLFGTGGKVGPELTGSNRANLEYLLSNILDPSAVMAKEYQPSVIVTGDGRVLTGIVKQQDANAVTVQTANEVVVLPRGEVDEIKPSQQSMMPDDLLKPLSPYEVRSLVAYLASPAQVAPLATSDNLKNFFNGRDLSGWQGDTALWSVENGEIVGRTAGLKQNEFLKNDLVFGDFRLRVQVQLVGNRGNSGIQFRSEPIDGGLVKGYQADVGAGWWGKLYEEHGRELLWTQLGRGVRQAGLEHLRDRSRRQQDSHLDQRPPVRRPGRHRRRAARHFRLAAPLGRPDRSPLQGFRDRARPRAKVSRLIASRDILTVDPCRLMRLVSFLSGWAMAVALAASAQAGEQARGFSLTQDDGYRGIWYSVGKTNDQYAYKYSGGMATYPQQHVPIAIYAPAVDKTFFVYGGTERGKQNLLHMVSYFDHATGTVPRPRILLDKHTGDAHDNPTLAIDRQGHLWIFSNAHGTSRPAFIHRGTKPYAIDEFELVAKTNFSYSQPRVLDDGTFFVLHTRYKAGRGLFWMTSGTGRSWGTPHPLAHIAQGHYQVSDCDGRRVASVFNYHPSKGGLDARTNLYYLETPDGGRSWQTVDGQPIETPLVEVHNPALVADYESQGLLVYLKEVQFDADGHPVILFLTSRGHAPGPANDPRRLRTSRWTGSQWETRDVTTTDHNYDFGPLYIEPDGTWRGLRRPIPARNPTAPAARWSCGPAPTAVLPGSASAS